MFSNTLNFLSSRNVKDQVSYPYKTTGKILYHLYRRNIISQNSLTVGFVYEKYILIG